MPDTNTLDEVREVETLLGKATAASRTAAMWFSDISDLRDESSGEGYDVRDAARLLGIAVAAKYDAECAVDAAEGAVAVLLDQYQLAEQDVDDA